MLQNIGNIALIETTSNGISTFGKYCLYFELFSKKIFLLQEFWLYTRNICNKHPVTTETIALHLKCLHWKFPYYRVINFRFDVVSIKVLLLQEY